MRISTLLVSQASLLLTTTKTSLSLPLLPTLRSSSTYTRTTGKIIIDSTSIQSRAALSLKNKQIESQFRSFQLHNSAIAYDDLSKSSREQISTHYHNMPRGVKKENLPTKVCVTCNRPFTWRKKWEKVWDEVTTCSKSCNRKRRQKNSSAKLMMKHQMKEHGDEAQHRTDSIMERSSCCDEDETLSTFSSLQMKSQGESSNMNDTTATDMGEKQNMQKVDSTTMSSDHDVDTLSTLLLDLNVLPLPLSGDEFASTNDDNVSHASANSISAAQTDVNIDDIEDPVARRKAQRKAEKKRKKAERRANREGRGDKSVGQKNCDVCGKSVDLLIRCTIDESQQWKMVCGSCWNGVSGGVVDGDANHPYYKYGGLWKNRKRK